MNVLRIVGPDGKLLGFNVNGRIVERNDTMSDDLSMRDLEIRMLHRLMTSPKDEHSPEAKRLIELDRLRIKELEGK